MTTVGGSVGPLIGGFDFPGGAARAARARRRRGSAGRRTVTLEELFQKRLARDEMLVRIEVDPRRPRSGSSFLKHLPRGVIETPTVNAAACVELDAEGTLHGARASSWAR